MPTTNPRVIVPLTPHLHDLLSRVAAMEGQTVGRLILTMIGQTEPLLTSLVQAADAFQSFKSKNKDTLVAALSSAEDDLAAVLRATGALQDVSAGVISRLSDAALGAPGAAPSTARAVQRAGVVLGSDSASPQTVQPPYSNTGVITQKSLKSLGSGKPKNSPKKGGKSHAI